MKASIDRLKNSTANIFWAADFLTYKEVVGELYPEIPRITTYQHFRFKSEYWWLRNASEDIR